MNQFIIRQSNVHSLWHLGLKYLILAHLCIVLQHLKTVQCKLTWCKKLAAPIVLANLFLCVKVHDGSIKLLITEHVRMSYVKYIHLDFQLEILISKNFSHSSKSSLWANSLLILWCTVGTCCRGSRCIHGAMWWDPCQQYL